MLLTNYTSALANARVTFNGLNKTETTTLNIANNLPTKRVLGYAIDDDGYFTTDFNKAAKIPEHIKIHSSTMESMQRALVEKPNLFNKLFSDIDIAKTIGNAYKVLSQLVDEETLKKESFTKDEIVNLPQGYEFDRSTLEVSKVHEGIMDYINADMSFNYHNKLNQLITSTFYNPVDWSDRYNPKFAPASDIFNNVNGGKEHKVGWVWDTTADKYTNSDGAISMGGILTAMVNGSSLYLVEGKATYWGQMQGYDRNVDPEKIRAEYQASWGKSVFDYTDRELNMMSEQRRDFIKGMQEMQMKIWTPKGYGGFAEKMRDLFADSSSDDMVDTIVAAYEAVDREFKEYLEELRQKLIEERQKAQEKAKKQEQKEDIEKLYEQSNQTIQEIVQLLQKIQEEANKNKDPKNQWNVSADSLQKAIMDMLNAQNQQAYALANRQQMSAQVGAFDMEA